MRFPWARSARTAAVTQSGIRVMTSINTPSSDVDLTGDTSSVVDLLSVTRRGAPRMDQSTIVLWVFRDVHDYWCVRQEGGHIETFSNRDKAVDFARNTGLVWGSYRLFLELKDGRVAQEFFNLDCQ
jgi:hypothetical protein